MGKDSEIECAHCYETYKVVLIECCNCNTYICSKCYANPDVLFVRGCSPRIAGVEGGDSGIEHCNEEKCNSDIARCFNCTNDTRETDRLPQGEYKRWLIENCKYDDPREEFLRQYNVQFVGKPPLPLTAPCRGCEFERLTNEVKAVMSEDEQEDVRSIMSELSRSYGYAVLPTMRLWFEKVVSSVRTAATLRYTGIVINSTAVDDGDDDHDDYEKDKDPCDVKLGELQQHAVFCRVQVCCEACKIAKMRTGIQYPRVDLAYKARLLDCPMCTHLFNLNKTKVCKPSADHIEHALRELNRVAKKPDDPENDVGSRTQRILDTWNELLCSEVAPEPVRMSRQVTLEKMQQHLLTCQQWRILSYEPAFACDPLRQVLLGKRPVDDSSMVARKCADFKRDTVADC